MADCWSCGAERGEAAFCETCGLIQDVSKRLDYFSALSLDRRMGLERSELDRAFRETAKRVHPDRFPRDEPGQRRRALAHTELVNHAYRVLRDPRTRGEYLLELEGVEVASGSERTEDPAFLMAILEKQEQVERIVDSEALGSLKKESRERYETLLTYVSRYFDEGEGELESVRKALGELRYERRMLDQIARREEELL